MATSPRKRPQKKDPTSLKDDLIDNLLDEVHTDSPGSSFDINWSLLVKVIIAGVLLTTLFLIFTGKFRSNSLQTATPAANLVPAGTLSKKDHANLVFMRQEEKLAWDVYQEMYRVWGMSVFRSISGEEIEHMASMLRLLQIYNIPDPIKQGDMPGEYASQYLRNLYQTLTQDEIKPWRMA